MVVVVMVAVMVVAVVVIAGFVAGLWESYRIARW